MQTTHVIETTARADREVAKAAKAAKAKPKEPTQWEALCKRSEGLTWSLTPELDTLNTFPDLDDGTRELFRVVAQRSRRIQTRYLCQIRPPALKMILDAIVTRTLDFRKFAEKITHKQFVYGVVDKGGRELLLDEDGVPIFNGLELSKNTIASSICMLRRMGLIEQFKYMKGTTVVYAYMPFPREFLAVNLATLVDGFFVGDAKKVAGYHATIENMLGMVENRWPAGERLPLWLDYKTQEFYQGNGIPRPEFTEAGRAKIKKDEDAKIKRQKASKTGPGTKI